VAYQGRDLAEANQALLEANTMLSRYVKIIKKLDNFSTLLIEMNNNGLENIRGIEVAQKLESILSEFEKIVEKNSE